MAALTTEQITIIRAGLDASAYRVGANVIIAAQKEMAAAGGGVVTSQKEVSKTLLDSGAAFDKHRTRIDETYRSIQLFARIQDDANRAVKDARVSEEAANQVLGAYAQKLGLVSNAAVKAQESIVALMTAMNRAAALPGAVYAASVSEHPDLSPGVSSARLDAQEKYLALVHEITEAEARKAITPEAADAGRAKAATEYQAARIALDQYNAALERDRAATDAVFATSRTYAAQLEKINALRQSGAYNEAQEAAAIDRLNASYAETTGLTKANADEAARLTKAEQDAARATADAADQALKAAAALEAERRAMDAIYAASKRYEDSLARINALEAKGGMGATPAANATNAQRARDDLNKSFADSTGATRANADEAARLTKAEQDAARATADAADQALKAAASLESERRAMDSIYASSKRYEESLERINALEARGGFGSTATTMTAIQEARATGTRPATPNSTNAQRARDELQQQYMDSTGATKANADEVARLAKVQKDAADATLKNAAALESERRAMDAIYGASKRYEDSLARINALEAKGGFGASPSANASNADRARADLNRNYAASMDELNKKTKEGGDHLHTLGNLSASATREFIVLGHEIVSGNFSRIPGSLMVLTEYMDGLRSKLISFLGFFTTGPGMIVAGFAAAGAAVLALGISAENSALRVARLQLSMRGSRDDYVAMTKQAESAARELAKTTTLSTQESRDIAGAIGRSPDFGGVSKNIVALGKDIQGLEAIMGIGLPEATKIMVDAMAHPGTAAEQMVGKLKTIDGPMAAYIMNLEKQGKQAEAFALLLARMREVTTGATAPLTRLDEELQKLWKTFAGTSASGRDFTNSIGGQIDEAAANSVRAIRGLIEELATLREKYLEWTKIGQITKEGYLSALRAGANGGVDPGATPTTATDAAKTKAAAEATAKADAATAASTRRVIDLQNEMERVNQRIETLRKAGPGNNILATSLGEMEERAKALTTALTAAIAERDRLAAGGIPSGGGATPGAGQPIGPFIAGPPSGPGASSADEMVRVKEMIKGFTDRGETLSAAIALTARSVLESGARWNGAVGDSGKGGVVGGSHGSFQWNRERIEAFKARNNQLLPEQTSLAAQQDFVEWERANTERDNFKKIDAAGSLEDKARAVSRYYIRPGLTDEAKTREAEATAAKAREIATATGNAALLTPGTPGAEGVGTTGKRAIDATQAQYESMPIVSRLREENMAKQQNAIASIAAEQEKLNKAMAEGDQGGVDRATASVEKFNKTLTLLRGEATNIDTTQRLTARAAEDSVVPLNAEAGATRDLATARQKMVEEARAAGTPVDEEAFNRVRTATLKTMSVAVNDNVAALLRQAAAQERLTPIIEKGGIEAQLAANRERAVEEARKTSLPGTAERGRQIAAVTAALNANTMAARDNQAATNITRHNQEIELLKLEASLIDATTEKREREIAILRERQTLGLKMGEQATVEQKKSVDAAVAAQALAAANHRAAQAMQEVAGTAEQVANTIGTSFVDAFSNGKTAAKSFNDTMMTVSKTILNEFIKLGAINPLLNSLFPGTQHRTTLSEAGNVNLGGLGWLSKLFGGGSGATEAANNTAGLSSWAAEGTSTSAAAGASAFLDSGAWTFHTGGLVGEGAATRTVDPALFVDAPRLHDGLASDEFRAILQRNERVLTAAQDQMVTRQLKSVSNDPMKNASSNTRDHDTRATMAPNTDSVLRTEARVNVYHFGGRVGESAPTRTVDPAWFDDAPHFETGFANDEFAAILHRNERVLTAGQDRMAMRQLKTVSEAPADTTASTTHVHHWHITTPNADSFQRSEAQVTAMASRALARASRRMGNG